MALIICPECGKQISDKAETCIGCGYPIKMYVHRSQIDIEEIMNIYEDSTDGAIRYIMRTYGLNKDDSTEMVMTFYNKVMTEKDSPLYEKIQKKQRKVAKQEKKSDLIDDLKAFSDRVREKEAESKIARCPKCHSTSISYQGKISYGRAAVGGFLAGGTGAVLGGLTGKKGYAVCLNCGKRWKV